MNIGAIVILLFFYTLVKILSYLCPVINSHLLFPLNCWYSSTFRRVGVIMMRYKAAAAAAALCRVIFPATFNPTLLYINGLVIFPPPFSFWI